MLQHNGPSPSPHPGNPELHSSEQELEEILLVGMGPLQSHPHLMALIDQELVVYRAFPFQQSQNPGHLQLRFSKVCDGFLSKVLSLVRLQVHLALIAGGGGLC